MNSLYVKNKMKKRYLLIILLNLFLSIDLFAAKNLYISYSKIPDSVYKNQKFEVAGQKNRRAGAEKDWWV